MTMSERENGDVQSREHEALPVISPIPESLRIQAGGVQEHLLILYRSFIPVDVIEANNSLIDRISIINDSPLVDALQEWRYEEIEITDGEVQMSYVENDPKFIALDRNTGWIHIFDRSGTITDDEELLKKDPEVYTPEEAEFLDLQSLSYSIVLQYLDKSLPISFRISAAAYYSEVIMQKMGSQTPFDEWFMWFHTHPVKLYVKAGKRYGDDLHKMAFGTLDADYMRKRNIKRAASLSTSDTDVPVFE